MGTLEKFAYRQSCIITHFEFSSPTFAEVKIWFQLDDSNCSSERERRTEVVRKFKDFIILNVFFYLVREDDSNCTSHYLKTKDKLAKKPPWLTRLFLKNCLKASHSNHASCYKLSVNHWQFSKIGEELVKKNEVSLHSLFPRLPLLMHYLSAFKISLEEIRLPMKLNTWSTLLYIT